MDWLSAGTIIPGLILVVFALTDSSHAPEGWGTSYILASLFFWLSAPHRCRLYRGRGCHQSIAPLRRLPGQRCDATSSLAVSLIRRFWYLSFLRKLLVSSQWTPPRSYSSHSFQSSLVTGHMSFHDWGHHGVDIAYSVSSVFITTQTPSNKQGLAGALINSTLFIRISFFLGIADIVVAQLVILD